MTNRKSLLATEQVNALAETNLTADTKDRREHQLRIIAIVAGVAIGATALFNGKEIIQAWGEHSAFQKTAELSSKLEASQNKLKELIAHFEQQVADGRAQIHAAAETEEEKLEDALGKTAQKLMEQVGTAAISKDLQKMISALSQYLEQIRVAQGKLDAKSDIQDEALEQALRKVDVILQSVRDRLKTMADGGNKEETQALMKAQKRTLDAQAKLEAKQKQQIQDMLDESNINHETYRRFLSAFESFSHQIMSDKNMEKVKINSPEVINQHLFDWLGADKVFSKNYYQLELVSISANEKKELSGTVRVTLPFALPPTLQEKKIIWTNAQTVEIPVIFPLDTTKLKKILVKIIALHEQYPDFKPEYKNAVRMNCEDGKCLLQITDQYPKNKPLAVRLMFQAQLFERLKLASGSSSPDYSIPINNGNCDILTTIIAQSLDEFRRKKDAMIVERTAEYPLHEIPSYKPDKVEEVSMDEIKKKFLALILKHPRVMTNGQSWVLTSQYGGKFFDLDDVFRFEKSTEGNFILISSRYGVLMNHGMWIKEDAVGVIEMFAGLKDNDWEFVQDGRYVIKMTLKPKGLPDFLNKLPQLAQADGSYVIKKADNNLFKFENSRGYHMVRFGVTNGKFWFFILDDQITNESSKTRNEIKRLKEFLDSILRRN